MTTTFAERLYQRLCAAADAGDPCPSNAQLADELGVLRDADITEQLALLIRRNRIIVHYARSRRVIAIVASGRMTGKTATPVPAHVVDPTFRGAVPEHQRVNRDPCQRCGVRADFGCEHSRAPIGVRMGL